MINKDNFKNLLEHLNFNQENNIFTKTLNNADLKVDFNNEDIIYPEAKGLIVNDKTTCNFSSNENFVVFECVHRLLAKGYKAEHLELEPKWKLGHTAKGGKADILVKDNENIPLLLIECKTFGDEFEKEKKRMETNGGQLFSYLRQEGRTKYLCLYSSDFDKQKNNINYQNAIIKIIDRKEDIEAYKNGDESIKLYKNATNNKELFEVWKDTFNLYFHYNGIFDYDVNAYEIELKPLKKKDLKSFSEASGTFNIFMEILRHNNISDNANAFNRILSLLLCKIVDEEKTDDEVLDFQVKEGEDTPEKIQDRLQKLYAKGMREHLNEKIVYFEDKVIKNIIKKYPKQTPIEELEDIFKQIKYYSNNEFALKEVHNKELFIQNSRVLNEIIKMLQNYRFRYTKKQQFLGDFFELLLNHGVKQSEGQFFTPVPIVRFIILSIGLDKIVKKKIANNEKNFLPKILDYACGSGHFLTESIDELQKYIEKLNTKNINDKGLIKKLNQYKDSTDWAEEYIFGIEKDYRLARTSQIACFLNGDGDANIIFGDGLENHDRLQLKTKFDVVIANPPYSIKSFKNYLNVNEKQYSLFDKFTEKSKEIEALFVERTAQVLKTNGRAGIIIKSSIISNNTKAEIAARVLLLENFNIKAIVELSNSAFGATGTNTVVLFLEKRAKTFKQDRQYIAQDLFNGIKRKKHLEHIDSNLLLKKFIEYREFKEIDYKSLIKRNANKVMQQSELYQEYKNWFDNLTEIKNLKRNFKTLSKLEQKQELESRFYDKILKIEQEKFYIFMLSLDANQKSQKTIIVKTGNKKEEAKAFLGYEFSKRKGDEGIKITRGDDDYIQTSLFDETNYKNLQKANSYILNNFCNKPNQEIDKSLRNNLQIAKLSDMLDFSRIDFNKAISLNPKQNSDINTKWELVKLREVTEIEKGTSITQNTTKKGNIKVVAGGIDYAYLHDESNRKSKIITISASGANAGYVNYWDEPIFASDCTTIRGKDKLINYYIFCILKSLQENIFNLARGTAQPHVYPDDIAEIKIPLPPLKEQQKIVQECEKVDKAVAQAQQTISNNKQLIKQKVQAVIINTNYPMKKLGSLMSIVRGASPRPIKKFLTEGKNGVNWIKIGDAEKDSKFITKTNQKITNEGAKKSRLVNIGDFILSNSMSTGRPYILKIDGCVHDGWLILSNIIKEVDKDFLFLALSSHKIQNEFKNQAVGGIVKNLNTDRVKSVKMPVPPIKIQKKLVTEIEKLEQQITQAQTIIDNSKDKKNNILNKYL